MIKEVLQQLEPLDAQIDALCSRADDAEMASTTTHAAELAELSAEENTLLQRCTSLTPADRVFLARRPDRPHITELIDNLFTDFFEQKGDRQNREDPSILGGIALYKGHPVTVIGHRKGKTLEENVAYNFGMPGPEGYRKAQRLMDQAEKFKRPVITFVDTPGAYPGLEAEARGQGEAIAENILEMMGLRTPVISVVIGEGGSGGALALALSDRVWILENAVYSVISPEGCASILWKDSKKVKDAAESLRLTAQDMLELGVVEQVIPEEKEFSLTYAKLQEELEAALSQLGQLPVEELLEQRYQRFRKY